MKKATVSVSKKDKKILLIFSFIAILCFITLSFLNIYCASEPAKPNLFKLAAYLDPYFYIACLCTLNFLFMLYFAIKKTFRIKYNKENLFYLISIPIIIILILIYNPLFFKLKDLNLYIIYWNLIHFFVTIYLLIYFYKIIRDE
jgi:hypothetical protein